MTQRAIDWDVASNGHPAPALADSDIEWPTVLPAPRVKPTRRVGVVKSYTPPKAYGLVEEASQGDAIFCIDDVLPNDRPKLGSGQTVTFEVVEGSDGRAAKRIRIDATTLPPAPEPTMVSRGWR